VDMAAMNRCATPGTPMSEAPSRLTMETLSMEVMPLMGITGAFEASPASDLSAVRAACEQHVRRPASEARCRLIHGCDTRAFAGAHLHADTLAPAHRHARARLQWHRDVEQYNSTRAVHAHGRVGILQRSRTARDDGALEITVENVADVDGDSVVDARHHGGRVQHLSAEVRQLHSLVVLERRDRKRLGHTSARVFTFQVKSSVGSKQMS